VRATHLHADCIAFCIIRCELAVEVKAVEGLATLRTVKGKRVNSAELSPSTPSAQHVRAQQRTSLVLGVFGGRRPASSSRTDTGSGGSSFGFMAPQVCSAGRDESRRRPNRQRTDSLAEAQTKVRGSGVPCLMWRACCMKLILGGVCQ